MGSQGSSAKGVCPESPAGRWGSGEGGPGRERGHMAWMIKAWGWEQLARLRGETKQSWRVWAQRLVVEVRAESRRGARPVPGEEPEARVRHERASSVFFLLRCQMQTRLSIFSVDATSVSVHIFEACRWQVRMGAVASEVVKGGALGPGEAVNCLQDFREFQLGLLAGSAPGPLRTQLVSGLFPPL